MKLTEHFTLEELTASKTAKVRKIDNTPSGEEGARLALLAIRCLEPARVALGKPITITSGYRCRSLNVAVGGVANSQHVRGEAADLQTADDRSLRELFSIIRQQGHFDQLLFETNKKTGAKWVHVSYVSEESNRKQAIDNYVV